MKWLKYILRNFKILCLFCPERVAARWKRISKKIRWKHFNSHSSGRFIKSQFKEVIKKAIPWSLKLVLMMVLQRFNNFTDIIWIKSNLLLVQIFFKNFNFTLIKNRVYSTLLSKKLKTKCNCFISINNLFNNHSSNLSN